MTDKCIELFKEWCVISTDDHRLKSKCAFQAGWEARQKFDVEICEEVFEEYPNVPEYNVCAERIEEN